MNVIYAAGLGGVFSNFMNTIVQLLNAIVGTPQSLLTAVAVVAGGIILLKGLNKGKKGNPSNTKQQQGTTQDTTQK